MDLDQLIGARDSILTRIANMRPESGADFAIIAELGDALEEIEEKLASQREANSQFGVGA